jgi:uncharacterized protein (TIGR02145 family)
MKKFYTLFLSIVLAASAFSQAPQKMSYQAVIRNSSNQLVTSHAVGMQISILQSSETGTPVYVETQTSTTNANGLVTIEIGAGTIITGTFALIDWSSGPYYIKSETDPSGGTNYSITGTSQLLSVPYALYSKTSENITNVFISFTGDTMFLGTNKIIVPGISAANQLKDIDGNVYKTVKIGNQIWMAENLKTTKFNDNSIIPSVTDNTEWAALTTPGYCLYDNDEATYKTAYGVLYNWYTVDKTSNGGKNVCPAGWHVPTDSEWTILSTFLGGESDAGGKLKETGTTHWLSPNTGATNETNFTALPGGVRYNNGDFNDITIRGHWWSSTDSPTNPWIRFTRYDQSNLARNAVSLKSYGFSVRCLRDF